MRRLLPMLLLAASAHATTLLDWGVPELTANSELVFVGTVVAQGVRAEGSRLFTDTTFDVERAWKGRAPVALTLSQPGGVWGERHHFVHGQAQFVVGERVVLFVERADTGALVVAGMALGKYTIEGGVAARRPFGLHRVERPLRFAGVPDEDRMPLTVLRARVHAERPRVVVPDGDLPRVLR
jgi:hypothetical protein